MADVRDIVTDSLTEIGVLAAGETAPAGDADLAFRALNRLVDQWAAERLLIYTVTRTTWTITASDGNYTVGTGANVNVLRPVFVDHVNFIDTSTDPDTEYPLERLTEDGWAGIALKALTGTFPTHWYYNPTFASGNATLDLWPVPTSATLTGVLYAPAAVAEFASLSTTISLPPGYRRMLVKNLALEIAPAFEREASQVLMHQAQDSMAAVKRVNRPISDLRFGADALMGGGSGGYNIRQG